MSKRLSYYVDEYKMLTKVTGKNTPKDGGDTAQRMGVASCVEAVHAHPACCGGSRAQPPGRAQ